MGMGIALMMLGVAAIGSSLIATLATVVIFGILLLLGAIFQVVTAVWGRSWRGSVLHLLAGVLYLIAGLFMIENPVEAAAEPNVSDRDLPSCRGNPSDRSGCV